MLANTSHIAPGPRGDWLVGNLRAFRRDVLGLMLASTKQYGDVVRFHIGPFVVHPLNHADHVEHVLQSHARNYDKSTRSYPKIRAISGDSLFNSNAELWQRQRRLMQPSFHRQSIARLAGWMIGLTVAMLAPWQGNIANGEPLDIASEVMRLRYAIVGNTLLGADVGEDSSTVESAMETILTHTFQRWGNIIDLPAFVPTPWNLRFRRALQTVDRIVYRIIAEHRSGKVENLPQLKFTTMVIQEAMRLYPAIWAIERRTIADDTIGEFHIPAGSSIVISPYALDRNESFWPNAERFDPTRFATRPRAYLPFGSGPRSSIGSDFAMTEARLIVPMVIQSCHLELVPGHPVEPQPSITLRPKNGLRMTIGPST